MVRLELPLPRSRDRTGDRVSPGVGDLLREVAEATTSGYRTRPVIVGPVTFLLLSKASESAPEGYQPLDRLDDLLPVYAELIAGLTAVGAEWVQLDEPALVSESIEVGRASCRERVSSVV